MLDTDAVGLYKRTMFNLTKLSAIVASLPGKPTRKEILIVNRGNLDNRGATEWAKQTFKSEVIPWLAQANGDPADIVTGQIVCNVHNNRVLTCHLKKMHRHKK